MISNNSTIISRKADRTISKMWSAELIESNDSLLIFLGVFETKVNHNLLGVIRPGTISYEFYWLDRWFNVFRFHEPDGAFRNFYCNINMPPDFKDGVLDYVDLDIDVVVRRDFTYDVLDRDEFEHNAEKFSYSDELRSAAENALGDLLNMIEKKIYPFNFKIDR